MSGMQVSASSMEHGDIQRLKPEFRQSLRLKIYVDKRHSGGNVLKLFKQW